MDNPFHWDGETLNDADEQPLPWWHRFLFSCVLSNLVVYGAMRLAFWSSFNSRRGFSGPGGGGEGLLEFGRAGILFGGVVVLFVAPIAICTLMATFRPWRRWYTAMAGGLGGVVAGALCGAAASWTIKLLSDP